MQRDTMCAIKLFTLIICICCISNEDCFTKLYYTCQVCQVIKLLSNVKLITDDQATRLYEAV